jgi:3-hydroxyisobutyrate dehydrogenase
MAGPVAVLGAGGTMGLPIARNLALAGMEVRAWNRSPGKAERLAADGAQIAASPGSAAAGASVVITMLADIDAVVAAMTDDRGALPVMGGSAVWLQMSTVGEADTVRCARLAEQHGVSFVDAPVLGSRQPAEERKLVVLASGPQDVRPLVQPVFDAVGQKTMWVGDTGAGTRLKLVMNSWVLTLVEGAAETIAFAEGLGLDPALFFDALSGGTLDLPYLRLKGTAMRERDFTPSFSLKLAAKDASLMCQSAERHGLDLPLINTIWRRMSEGAKEHGDEDFSATYLTSTPRKAE